MGVQLNIKDEDTVNLARRLAHKHGRSVTATVRAALEKLADDDAKAKRASVEEILAIGRRASRHWKPEYADMELSTQHGDLLYDEDGGFK
jgi:antitoxin VapB